MALLFRDRVSSEFASKEESVASKLGADADELMFVMSYETANTFSPSIQNPSSKATGLIGFLPSTAIGLGTTIEQLAKMSDVDQLDYVYQYLKPYRGDMVDLESTYLAVFYPEAINKEDSFVFPANVVSANPSFFKTGNTKADFRKGLQAIVYSRVPSSYYDKFFKKKELFCRYIKEKSLSESY